MNRKNKNILLVSAIVVLVAILILTFYCGYNHSYRSIPQNGTPIVEKNNIASKNDIIEKKRKTISKSKEAIETDDNTIIEEPKENIAAEDKAKNHDTKNGINKAEKNLQNIPAMKQNGKTMKVKSKNMISIKYVILILIESLLLGGTIVMLINNNLPIKINSKKQDGKEKNTEKKESTKD